MVFETVFKILGGTAKDLLVRLIVLVDQIEKVALLDVLKKLLLRSLSMGSHRLY